MCKIVCVLLQSCYLSLVNYGIPLQMCIVTQFRHDNVSCSQVDAQQTIVQLQNVVFIHINRQKPKPLLRTWI